MKLEELIGRECAISFKDREDRDESYGYSYYQVHSIDKEAQMICVTSTFRGGRAVWLPLNDINWLEVPAEEEE